MVKAAGLSLTGSGQATPGLAIDARSLDALKSRSDQPAAIKEAAKQLESLFMRELIKSMRDATMKSGLLDSSSERLGTDMFDQQMAVQMSGLPGGLSDAIVRQLTRQTASTESATGSTTTPVSATTSKYVPRTMSTALAAAPSADQTSFVQRLGAIANKVEQSSGIPASYMLGQAGHETAWGKREILMADGATSFNLFGIKAGAGWTGKVAEITTTEYVGGEARKVTAKFRAYDSYEESFRDYARLIGDSPRYAAARKATGSALSYATELQRAGYATDPDYASKLSRAINSTLRVARAQA